MENKTLKSCLGRLEKKIEQVKEDIRFEVARDVKRIVTATMKLENETLMKEINGEEIKKQVEEIKEENKVMNKLSEKEIEKQVNEYISTARNEDIQKEKKFSNLRR